MPFQNLVQDRKFSEILTGSAWALASRALSAFIAMIISILVARLYGVEMVGVVAMINSFLLLITIFTVLGTGTSILRLVPEHRGKYSATSSLKVYRKTHALVIVASLLLAAFLWLNSGFIAKTIFSKPDLSFYFALAASFAVFKSVSSLNTQAIRGLQRIKTFAFMNILPQGLNLLLLIGFPMIWPSKDIPVYALLGGFTLSGLLGWFLVERHLREKSHPHDIVHPVTTREILAISLPMLLASSMIFITAQAGVILLGVFRNESEVGYFSVALRMSGLATLILSSINVIMAPKIAELFHQDRLNELFHLTRQSSKMIFWVTTPVLLFLVLFGRFILEILFGKAFKASYFPMVIMLIGQFFNAISGSTGYFMSMTGRQKLYGYIMSLTGVGSIFLNLILIPELGLTGAAMASSLCILFWNTAILIFVKRTYGIMMGYFPLIRV